MANLIVNLIEGTQFKVGTNGSSSITMSAMITDLAVAEGEMPLDIANDYMVTQNYILGYAHPVWTALVLKDLTYKLVGGTFSATGVSTDAKVAVSMTFGYPAVGGKEVEPESSESASTAYRTIRISGSLEQYESAYDITPALREISYGGKSAIQSSYIDIPTLNAEIAWSSKKSLSSLIAEMGTYLNKTNSVAWLFTGDYHATYGGMWLCTGWNISPKDDMHEVVATFKFCSKSWKLIEYWRDSDGDIPADVSGTDGSNGVLVSTMYGTADFNDVYPFLG